MSRRQRTVEVRRTVAARQVRLHPAGDRRLSVIIPAYRESAAIAGTVERVRSELAAVAADGGLEVVVVDDGSGDGTAEAAHRGGADQVVALPHNRGKGAAVRAGVAVARGATVAFTDADLAYAPAQIARLMAEVEAGWDAVVGNRHHQGTTTLVRASKLRQLGGRAINAATRLVLVGGYHDTQCGLKAFRSDAARLLFGHGLIDGFAFDVEVFHLVERYGLSLIEVPVEVSNTDVSTVRVAQDAARLLVDLGRIRLHASQGRYDLADPAVPAPPSPDPLGADG